MPKARDALLLVHQLGVALLWHYWHHNCARVATYNSLAGHLPRVYTLAH